MDTNTAHIEAGNDEKSEVLPNAEANALELVSTTEPGFPWRRACAYTHTCEFTSLRLEDRDVSGGKSLKLAHIVTTTTAPPHPEFLIDTCIFRIILQSRMCSKEKKTPIRHSGTRHYARVIPCDEMAPNQIGEYSSPGYLFNKGGDDIADNLRSITTLFSHRASDRRVKCSLAASLRPTPVAWNLGLFVRIDDSSNNARRFLVAD